MCNSLESTPPIPVIAGAAVSHEDVVLEASDGNKFSAFVARPDEPASVAVVVLPDVRGLYRFYEEFALRFAERGYAAIAIDYYGRTDGVGRHPEDFPFMEKVQQTSIAGVQADIAAAIEYIRGAGGGGAVTTVFTAGCCFGGTQSWLASASGQGIAGAIGYHGGVGDRNGEPGPTARAGDMTAPILALQGGADPHITAEDNAEFDAALTAAGVEHEIILEPGAPHSYFDRLAEEYAEQSADAWQRTLEFIEKHSAVPA
jgi:carboxymethylenebutenolidase